MAVDIWMVTQLLLTFYTIKCRIELEVANQRYEAFPPPLPSPLFPIGKWDTYLRGEEGKAIFCQRKNSIAQENGFFSKKCQRNAFFWGLQPLPWLIHLCSYPHPSCWLGGVRIWEKWEKNGSKEFGKVNGTLLLFLPPILETSEIQGNSL